MDRLFLGGLRYHLHTLLLYDDGAPDGWVLSPIPLHEVYV